MRRIPAGIIRLKEWVRTLNPRQSFIFLQSLLATVFLIPLGIWRLAIGDLVRGGWDLLLVAILMGLSWVASREKYLDLVSRIIAAVLFFGVWLVLTVSGPAALMWSFVGMMALFFVLRLRDAVIAAVIMFIVCAVATFEQMSAQERTTFATCYTLISAFALIFSSGLWRENLRLEKEAMSDRLTDMPNRRAFDLAAEKAVADAGDNVSRFSMLVVDIDHFKQVNDTWGHAVGDICLSRVASLLKQDLPPGASLYRYGGEEFIAIIEGAAGATTMIAEQMREHVAHGSVLREREEPVTVSIGVSELRQGDDAISWMQRADVALYEAKETGRNRVVLA